MCEIDNTMVVTIVDILSIRPHNRSFNMNEKKRACVVMVMFLIPASICIVVYVKKYGRV